MEPNYVILNENMASPSIDFLRSPFKIVPDADTEALKQAFYTTAANLFVVFACGAAVAVYFVLEAFLRPLLWAVLCGTFLHPFKRAFSSFVRNWLRSLVENNTPITVGLLLAPVKIVNSASDAVGTFFSTNIKNICSAVGALIAIYILYYFGPLNQIFTIFQVTFYIIYDILEYFSAKWVWTIVAAYLLATVFYWNDQSQFFLKIMALPIWTLALLSATTWFTPGSLRVPVFVAMVALMLIGYLHQVDIFSASASIRHWFKRRLSTVVDFTNNASPNNSVDETDCGDTREENGENISDDCATDGGSSGTPSTARPSSLPITRQNSDQGSQTKKKRRLSQYCFIGLFWIMVLVRMWTHFWILQILPAVIALLLLKQLASHFGSKFQLFGNMTADAKSRMRQILEDRKDVLAPPAVQGLVRLVVIADRKLLVSLDRSVDQIMSVVFIFLLVVGTTLMAVLSAVQVHHETMHLVTVTSTVFNNSLHPELTQWLPGTEDMLKTFNPMVENVYVYGRHWIASKVDQLLGDEGKTTKNVENQLLEVWDRLYETWFSNSTFPNKSTSLISQRTSLINGMNITSVWDVMKMTSDFDLSGIINFLQANIGVVTSVFDSLWTLLKGNLNLAFTFVTVTFSMVFGGGTALLNFVLSGVIFITTLFYLLASSKDQFAPVKLFTSISPAASGKFGQAVEEAIGSVFAASLKMAVFYGLYTWTTHTAFGINIVFIPSALAAMFAAVPFLGTYWAALPAVVELWLVQGEGARALMLLICHIVPCSFVDTAIYSDIKGGGHPYLTGLAIGGGLYCFGLEGAIIGPILLCCLVVAMNVYTSMLSQGNGATVKAASRLGRQKKVSWNLQRAYSDTDASAPELKSF